MHPQNQKLTRRSLYPAVKKIKKNQRNLYLDAKSKQTTFCTHEQFPKKIICPRGTSESGRSWTVP